MTNAEKYKTAEERAEAFRYFCEHHANNGCSECALKEHTCSDTYPMECFAYWLDLEAEVEKPLPCPFCGSEVSVWNESQDGDVKYITCPKCDYESPTYDTVEKVIAAHNHVAKAVMGAKAKKKAE